MSLREKITEAAARYGKPVGTLLRIAIEALVPGGGALARATEEVVEKLQGAAKDNLEVDQLLNDAGTAEQLQVLETVLDTLMRRQEADTLRLLQTLTDTHSSQSRKLDEILALLKPDEECAPATPSNIQVSRYSGFGGHQFTATFTLRGRQHTLTYKQDRLFLPTVHVFADGVQVYERTFWWGLNESVNHPFSLGDVPCTFELKAQMSQGAIALHVNGHTVLREG